MADALKVKADKVESKGIKSYRSRVTNIRPLLQKDMNIETFCVFLLNSLMGTKLTKSNIYQLSPKDKKEISKLVESKYSTWEWNYGSSPSYSVEKRRRYPGGELVLRLNVENGTIKELHINGDFLSCGDTLEIEKRLQGTIYKVDMVEKILEVVGLENFMVNITKENFLDCLFN
jgi:lipoate-protein ligase A